MLAFIALFALASPATVAAAKCDFPAIFNFGDSNSDTGGFWAAFPAQPGPFGMTYFKKPAGRASDGRLVIDFVAQALGLPFLSPYLQSIGSNFRHGANFATLASTVLLPNTSLFVSGISPFSLAIQLNQMKEFRKRVYEMHHQEYLPPKNVFRKSIYMFDIGQNDFTSNLSAIGIEGVNKFLPQVAYQIAWTIQEIYKFGGRKFMVFNLAPVGCYPSFLAGIPHRRSDLDNYGCVSSYNKAVMEYNKVLKDILRRTGDQLPGALVAYVDTFSVKLDLFRNPKRHGLLYGTRACCGTGGGTYNFNSQVYCGNTKVIDGKNITATVCKNPGKHVSWDGIHATEAANKIVAKAVLNGSYSDPSFPLSKFCKLKPIG